MANEREQSKIQVTPDEFSCLVGMYMDWVYDTGIILQLSASPAITAKHTACLLMTGRVPGCPRQTGQHCVFGALPKSVLQAQKSFVFVPSSIWVSSPATSFKFTA